MLVASALFFELLWRGEESSSKSDEDTLWHYTGVFKPRNIKTSKLVAQRETRLDPGVSIH